MRILLTRPHSWVKVAPIPTGLLYLATVLKEHGHDVWVYDGRVKHAKDADFLREFDSFKPDVIGITSFTIEWKEFHELCALVKKWNPDCKLVTGGPHASAYKENILKDPNIDHSMVGAAELTFPKLIQGYADGEVPTDIGGLCWRDESGEGHYNAHWDIIEDMDKLPFPAYDLIDMKTYTSAVQGYTQNRLQLYKRAFPIFTTRGCPYACDFCHNIFGRKLYKRSIENVMHEVDYLVREHGMQELHISDDIFNMNLTHAKAVMQTIIDRPYSLKIAFPNGLRADRVDDELIDLMKRAGVFRIMYAVETGSPAVQRRIKKNLKLEVAKETIRKTSEAGIHTGGFFMFGHADETYEEMMDTCRFALESRLDAATFFYSTPFPDTDLYHKAIERGVKPEYLEKLYTEFLGIGYDVLALNITKVPDEQIINLKKWVVRKFYFHPKRIISNIIRLPHPYVLIYNFIYVFRLATMKKTYR